MLPWISLLIGVFALAGASYTLGRELQTLKYIAKLQDWSCSFRQQTDQILVQQSILDLVQQGRDIDRRLRLLDDEYRRALERRYARLDRQHWKLWKKQMRRSARSRPCAAPTDIRTAQLCVGTIVGHASWTTGGLSWRWVAVRKSRQCPPLPLP